MDVLRYLCSALEVAFTANIPCACQIPRGAQNACQNMETSYYTFLRVCVCVCVLLNPPTWERVQLKNFGCVWSRRRPTGGILPGIYPVFI